MAINTGWDPPDAALRRQGSIPAQWLLGAFCFIALVLQDLLSSGIKTATQTDTACPAAKMFKMRVYLPVIVTRALQKK